MIDYWNKVLAQYKENLTSDMYGTWFSRIAYVENPTEEQNGKLTLSVPTYPHREYLSKNWKSRLEASLKELAGRNIEIVFIIGQPPKPAVPQEAPRPKPKIAQSATSATKSSSLEEKALRCGLHQGLTFDTFVMGQANRTARVSAETVSKYPGTRLNPFFIYGGVGLGKTHLMHATGRAMLASNPDMKILCISAYSFTKDVVNLSVGGHYSDEKVKQFEDKYQTVDALLIDDVQGLSHKSGSQSHLFGILEVLLPANKQVIFTCDTYARQLADFDERLISRMSKGLSVQIELAEPELRAAIVIEKAKQQGVELPFEVAFHIATKINTNIRELEGALNIVLLEAQVSGGPITVDLANKALRSIVSSGIISIEGIQKVTAEFYRINLSEMFSKSRKATFVLPRSVAMYLAKELTQKSLIDIGTAFGGRDHTTVLHAVKKIAKERSVNEKLNRELHLIEESLKNWQ